MVEERLLGFDIRESIGGQDHLWDAGRRQVFLLREDVRSPLSIDTIVWPSIFDYGQGIGLLAPEREHLHLAGIPVPQHIGLNVGLWADADKMRDYLKEHWIEPRPYFLIAISWFSDQGFSDAGKFGPYLAPTSPARCDPHWERLGFEVGDGSLVSGLSNCGYLPEEAPLLRKQWGTSLTENHLFDDLQPAFQFRDLTNERVPSHSPFFVYGLYIIDSIACLE